MGRRAKPINNFLGPNRARTRHVNECGRSVMRSTLAPGGASSKVAGMLGNFVLAAANAFRRRPPLGPPPATVPAVDLLRYMGRWYEVARLPNPEQDGAGRRLVDVTATYTPRRDGSVEVRNAARDAAAGMRPRGIVGRARTKDRTGAKLDVRFFRIFGGDYWVIGLDPDYRWAVVGTPTRRRLWVLARTPTLDAADWARIDAAVAAGGYDPARVVRTPHTLPPTATGGT
jgi:apolipoprotein D and lipocalin family protein